MPGEASLHVSLEEAALVGYKHMLHYTPISIQPLLCNIHVLECSHFKGSIIFTTNEHFTQSRRITGIAIVLMD